MSLRDSLAPPHTHTHALTAPPPSYPLFLCCSYPPGAEVFLCYGSHTNLELLELYGFLLDHNPHDTALLPTHTLQQHLQQAVNRYQQQQQGAVAGRRAHCRRQQHQQQSRPQWGGVVLDVAEAECWLHANGQPSWPLLKELR